jgi:hypothetical protein
MQPRGEVCRSFQQEPHYHDLFYDYYNEFHPLYGLEELVSLCFTLSSGLPYDNESLLSFIVAVVRFAESPNTKDRVISSFLESERNAKERLSLHKLTEVGSSLDIDTPDSGYFELEKTRKKSFISS